MSQDPGIDLLAEEIDNLLDKMNLNQPGDSVEIEVDGRTCIPMNEEDFLHDTLLNFVMEKNITLTVNRMGPNFGYAIYKLYKNMIEGKAKLREVKCHQIHRNSRDSFLCRIGIAFNDETYRFSSDRLIEVYEKLNKEGHIYYIFGGNFEIVFSHLRYDANGIRLQGNFLLKFHDTKESIDQAKSDKKLIRIQVTRPSHMEELYFDAYRIRMLQRMSRNPRMDRVVKPIVNQMRQIDLNRPAPRNGNNIKVGGGHFPLLSLPKEIIIDVFSHLSDKDRMNARVNKELKEIEEESKHYEKFLRIVETGNLVATFVLEAFKVYASGQFAYWDRNRGDEVESLLIDDKDNDVKTRNIIFQSILVEKIKEKDFFCCHLCEEALFNYKQALVHFTSNEHCGKENFPVFTSRIDCVRHVLDLFTKLPAKNGHHKRLETGVRPSNTFVYNLCMRNSTLFTPEGYDNDEFTGNPRFSRAVSSMAVQTEASMAKVKGAMGRKAMAELHKHLGEAPTYCVFCDYKTGDREGFYAHLISSVHMKAVGKDPNRFDILTFLVNVHRKDLI